jgi:ADP-L-glycero-D-manno-heptose 6-epimerase
MIAVTGAAGFIGSNLAHRLAVMGADLLLVDDALTPAKAMNLGGLTRFQFLRHDHFLEELAAGTVTPEAVYHLGACSSTTETDWDYLTRNNIEYTKLLWEWCSRNTSPLVYASSAATYGDGARGFDDRTLPSDLEPLNLYGKSKNDFDIWALNEVANGQRTPGRWAGVKFFNVYGPREAHKGRMASMVYHSHRQILRTGKVKLFKSSDSAYPDGGQLRDFVFVNDCVEHLLWLGQHDHGNGLFNSGTGTPRTFLDLAKATFAAMGREPVIEFIPMPADLARQYQNYTRADVSKLREAGCSVAVTSLEEGVRETVSFLESAVPGD